MNNKKKEKYKMYIKNMKKINNLKKKFILIQSYHGFGNLLFDCIIGIYLKYNFNYEIYYVNTISAHTKKGDPFITEVFTKLNNEFIIITNEEGDYINYILNYQFLYIKSNSLKNLQNYFTKDKDEDKIILKPHTIYNLVFDIYDTFTPKMKQIFTVNEKLIDKQILSYSKTTYATIHIRYGDKLKLGIKGNNNNFITFPIYTPEYYYEQIKLIKKLKIPIVILTDSYQVVKHFILEKYNLTSDPDIFIPNIQFIDSFYLLLYSSYVVMSHSTFSYGAYLLSKDNFKNKKRVYTFCTTKEFFTIYNPADLFISKEWTIYENKNYILNFNQEKIKEMYEYNEKNKISN